MGRQTESDAAWGSRASIELSELRSDKGLQKGEGDTSEWTETQKIRSMSLTRSLTMFIAMGS